MKPSHNCPDCTHFVHTEEEQASATAALELLRNLGTKLKEARKARDLTQWDVGIVFGLSNAAISRIELGHAKPSPELSLKILNWIYGLDPVPVGSTDGSRT